MPFLGVDPWRWQYFEKVAVPRELGIPIDEASAWELYPERRWIHNKIEIAASQGLPHGPHGVMPRRFPVFSKPIFNMRGMGTGGRAIRSAREYLLSLQPGHMWMRLPTGPHVSTDVALARRPPGSRGSRPCVGSSAGPDRAPRRSPRRLGCRARAEQRLLRNTATARDRRRGRAMAPQRCPDSEAPFSSMRLPSGSVR